MAKDDNNDNVLGIQATINGSDIEKGANDFIRKITEMEKASNDAISSMSKHFQWLNDEILEMVSSIEKSRIELEKISKPTSNPTAEAQAATSEKAETNSVSRASSNSIREKIEAKRKQKELNATIKEEEELLKRTIAKRDALTASIKRYNKELEDAIKWQKENADSDANNVGGKAVEDAKKKLEEATKRLQELEVAISETDEGIIALYENLETYSGKQKKSTKTLKEQESVLVKMLGGAENYKEIMSALPASIREAGDNIGKMTGAAKKFIATPLGTILGALILAFQAVKTYLTSTVEGQERLAKITGFVTGALRPFKELVISIGKALVDAFAKPQETIKNLGNLIITNIVNRLEGVAEMVVGLATVIAEALSFDVEGTKQALKDVGNAFGKFVTGVDNVGEKLKNGGKQIVEFGKKVAESGSKGASVAVDTRALDLEIEQWEKRKQQLEAKKQQARGIVSNTSLSTKERMEAEKEYEKILDEEYRMELSLINKRIELQKRAKPIMSIEDEAALQDLETERERIIADYQRSLAERQDTNAQLINSEREALIELGNLEADLILKNQNRQISIMKDGHAKRLEELKTERESELQSIKELEDKFIKQNRRAGIETGEDGLTDTQRNNISKAREGVEENFQHGVKESLKSELSEIMTYQQARLKVEEEYAEKRKALYQYDENGNIKYDKDGKALLNEGVDEGNVVELHKNETNALQAVDEQFASKSQVYLGWLESISDMTIVQLSRALGKAQAELDSLESKSDANPEDLAIARAKIAELQEKIEKLEGQGDDSSQRSIDTWKELGDVLGDTASQFEALGDTIGGTAGEIISSLGSTFTSTVGLMNNIVQFVEICDKGIMNTAGTAVSAVKAVEAASVILAVISIAIQVIQKIANVAKNLHNKQYEKTIEDNQKKIDGLKESYNELEEAASKAYSSDKVSKLREINENLEQQNRLIQEQKDAEKSKKGDIDTTQYDEAMEANREQMEKNKEAMEEVIFGEDIQSAIENFAEAYAEALEGNMSMNATAKEQAVRMMKNMVMESIKEYVAGSKKMEQIRAKMDALYADGVFSEADQKLIINELEQFNKELDDRFGWAEDLFSEDSSSNSSSSKRGIATASQESVDENNGRLMSIQLSMGEITTLQRLTQADTAAIRNDIAVQNRYISEIVDIQYDSLSYLSSIDKNTKELYQINTRLGQIEANTRQTKR